MLERVRNQLIDDQPTGYRRVQGYQEAVALPRERINRNIDRLDLQKYQDGFAKTIDAILYSVQRRLGLHASVAV